MRTLLVVLLSLVALSMVITLVPGFGSPSLDAGDDQTLAVIGDDKVMAADVRARVDELVRGQRLPPQLISAYVPQIVDGFIADRAEGLMSKELGNIIPDAELARVIQSSLPNLFEGGTVDKARYQDAVRSMGRTVQQFESDMRLSQLGLRIRNMSEDAAVVSPADVEAEYNRRNVKLRIEYVSFNFEKMKSQVVPSEADMRALFNNSRGNYPVAEKRDMIVLVADQNQIAAKLEVPEADLKTAYAQQIDRFKTPERVKARHILVMTKDKPAAEQAALKSKAEGLLKQVKGGADFAELAKKNSDDTSSAVKGGDLGFFGRGAMVPEFEAAAFKLKPGETTDLVKTDFGYHIIRSEDKEIARIKPFEEVKGELIAALRGNKVLEMTQSVIEKARAEVVKDPSQAEAIGAKYNLQVIKAEKVGAGDPLPALGQAADLTAAAFSVALKGVTPVVQPQSGKLAIAMVTGLTAARMAEYEEARDRIKEAFQNVKGQELAQNKAKEAADKLLAPGADWKALAKSMGAELKKSESFAPEGSIEGLGGASMLGDLLQKPVGAAAGPISITGQWVIARIAERTEPDPAGMAAARTSISLNLKQKAATDRYLLIRDSLLNKLIEEGKVKKNKKAIERLLAAYSSQS